MNTITINEFIKELQSISEDKRKLPLYIVAPNGLEFKPEIKMGTKDGMLLGEVIKMYIQY